MLNEQYTEEEQAYLLNLARATIYCYLLDRSLPKVDEKNLPVKFKQDRACFVTLNKKGSGLRGCIGYITPVTSLYRAVIDRAVAASTQDPRFPSVNYNELKDINLEISILTIPIELVYSNTDDLLNKLKPAKHGVIIETRYGSSTFLPQVWEHLPDKEEFLSNLCMKHGAPHNEWRNNSGIKIYTYEAIVLEDKEYGKIAVGNKGAVVGPNGATITGKAVWGHISDDKKQEATAGTKLEPYTILSSGSDVIQNK